MQFRILGPLYADAGNGTGPARISQPLLQSALAVLLLRANRPCPRQWLIEALWGSEPPDKPEAALRVCISRLRRCLGDCGSRLHSVGPPGGSSPGHRQQRGYLMTVRPGELDLDEFADLTSQGEAELELGNAVAAATALMQALALWGDPALPDLPDTPAVNAALTGLKSQRRHAADALIDARLAAGEHQHVLAELRTAALADPAHERTCAQLMRAYMAMGMPQEALAAYQRARRAMLQEQGAEPGPVLVSLQRRILEADSGPDAAAVRDAGLARVACASPGGGRRPPATGRGRAAKADASMSAVGADASAAGGAESAADRMTQPAWQVPPPPADFVGREGELATVVAHLSGSGVPLAVISGGPGSGKSALAAFAAVTLRGRFPGGQLYAELGGIESPRDPQDTIADILHGLGIRPADVPPAGPARAALYRTIVADRKVLVIADDAAAAVQIRPLIPPAPGSAVLVTSRSRLSGLASARIVPLAGLSDGDALTMLRTIAGDARLESEPSAVAAMLSLCAGLPLALRLVGAVLAASPGLSAIKLARTLSGDQALGILEAEDISMRGAIAPSYRSLTPAAQAALAAVAAHVPAEIPSWTLTADGSSDVMIANEIVATGLLAPIAGEGIGPRYAMHPLTRAFVRSTASSSFGSVPAAPSGLLAGWLRRADLAVTRLPALPFLPLATLPADVNVPPVDEPNPGPAWLDAERTNLLAAVSEACASATALAAALASRVTNSECLHGRYQDAMNSWQAIAAAARAHGDARCEAMASYYLAAVIAESHGRIWESIELLKACLPVLEEAGNLRLAALGQCLLARCASAYGQSSLAVEAIRQAERLASDDPEHEMARCMSTAIRGLAVARMGMVTAGADNCKQAVRQARVLGEPVCEAMAVRALAQVHILGRSYPAAAAACSEGITLSRVYGSRIAAARFLTLLGRARHCDNDPRGAAEPLLEALEIFRATGATVEEATAASLLAACRQQSGDRAEAAEYLRQVVGVLEREGTRDAQLRAAVAQTACELPGS